MENEQNKPMQTPAPYAAGTGSVPVALDRDAFARMGNSDSDPGDRRKS